MVNGICVFVCGDGFVRYMHTPDLACGERAAPCGSQLLLKTASTKAVPPTVFTHHGHHKPRYRSDSNSNRAACSSCTANSFTINAPSSAGVDPATEAVGCFLDTSRVPQFLLESSDSMTPEKCRDLTLKGGFRFYALQNGSSCFADYFDNRDGVIRQVQPAIVCSAQCTGAPAKTCGGQVAISLYGIGEAARVYPASPGCLAHTVTWHAACPARRHQSSTRPDRIALGTRCCLPAQMIANPHPALAAAGISSNLPLAGT